MAGLGWRVEGGFGPADQHMHLFAVEWDGWSSWSLAGIGTGYWRNAWAVFWACEGCCLIYDAQQPTGGYRVGGADGSGDTGRMGRNRTTEDRRQLAQHIHGIFTTKRRQNGGGWG